MHLNLCKCSFWLVCPSDFTSETESPTRPRVGLGVKTPANLDPISLKGSNTMIRKISERNSLAHGGGCLLA